MNSPRLLQSFGIALFLLGAGMYPASGGTAVVYSPSSGKLDFWKSTTPAGGNDYLDSPGACHKELERLTSLGLTDGAIIYASDRTGFFCIVAGLTDDGGRRVSVGYGATQPEAETTAMDLLAKAGVTREQRVEYTYFSWGDSPATGGGASPN